VTDVILSKCAEQGVKAFFVDADEVKLLHHNLSRQTFRYKNLDNLKIPLLGEHQLLNAASVIETVWVLSGQNFYVSEEALRDGLKRTKWPARFEILSRKPIFILDGAHNPQSVRVFTNTLSLLFPAKKVTFVFGVLEDKDYAKMTETLIPFAKDFFTVTPDSPRALSAAELADYILKADASLNATACDSIGAGVKAALAASKTDDIICAVGSLHIAREVRKILQGGF
jgi:dihydrofolate synthase/folylpolyglutamate synthase